MQADETYYMTFCVYSDPLPVNNKTNPNGIHCGGAGVGLATSKTPDVKESWVRHGYNCHNSTTKSDNCGATSVEESADFPSKNPDLRHQES